jgi:hypothetical protein
MRGLVSPMPLRRSYRTKFRVFSGEAEQQKQVEQLERLRSDLDGRGHT